MRSDRFRHRLEQGEPALGGWLTMGSVTCAEYYGTRGFDYVCVDTQHGLADYEAMLAQLRALPTGGPTALVRVRWNEPGAIGKALDAGAQGVIVPMVNSGAEAQQVVTASRYPPAGERSYGPVRPLIVDGVEYASQANERVWVIPMVETISAVERLDEILSVPGIDAVYVGPADLALSMGLRPGTDAPEFIDALRTITDGCRRHDVVPGIHTSAAEWEQRAELGFAMCTVSTDLVTLRAAVQADADAVGRGSGVATPSSGPY